jgi:transposase-like protein
MKCPKCNVKNSRYRIKTQDYICNSCGYNWTAKAPVEVPQEQKVEEKKKPQSNPDFNF